MASTDIDTYLAGVEEPKRSTLEALRRTIHDLVPEAEEGISYGVPAFLLGGVPIAGFAAAKGHLSYFPHSGSVISQVPEAAGYDTSRGTLRFAIDTPLPRDLVERLLQVRMRMLDG